ncbi:conserved Plasmodium protein, unknown function [Plasmodium ovale]|uniref:Uncharacterized protein n=2 Tax=Plasmodium ovale TaxID=36330 RepID=A0A1C3L5B9_PLAOA|nr:conserved Plasmodium protein, unknown function [Plasmodium ovale]
MSSQIGSNYLNNVYTEFNLFNNFLRDLSQKIKSSNNEKYTLIYDSCIENAYNIQNKFYAWNNNEEDIDEKFMEYFSQNFIINIKTFLRNNFDSIDENLENLKIRNRKLIEKLKAGLENAENQENYIYELERSLKTEKEKNRNVHNLLEKISTLMKENEKLKNKNEQLEMSSWKQQEENSKIKIELKKFLSLEKKEKKSNDNKLSYSMLNKNMSTLFKEINNNMQKNKNDKVFLKGKRSYSFNFLHTLKNSMLSDTNIQNQHRGQYLNKRKNYSTPNAIKNNPFDDNHDVDDEIKEKQNLYCSEKHMQRCESSYNMNNSATFLITEGDKRGICGNNLSGYKIEKNVNFLYTNEEDAVDRNSEYANKEITKNIQSYCGKHLASKNELRNIYHMEDYPTYQCNYLPSHNTTLLMDIRRTLRLNRTVLMNTILKKRIHRIRKRKKGNLGRLFKLQKSKIITEAHNEGDQMNAASNMIIEDCRSTIHNFYECIKEDIRIITEQDDNMNLELFSNYFKNIIKEIRNEKNKLKKKKIDKITRKLLRQIDSYRLREKDFFYNITDVENKCDKQFNLSYNKYDSFDLRKILKNNYHEQQDFNSDNEEPLSFSFYKNRNIRIIDRLKDLKNNISFFKFYDLVDFPNKL